MLIVKEKGNEYLFRFSSVINMAKARLIQNMNGYKLSHLGFYDFEILADKSYWKCRKG